MRRLALLATALMIVLGPATPSALANSHEDAPGDPSFSARTGDEDIWLTGSVGGVGKDQAERDQASGQKRVLIAVAACDGNEPSGSAPRDALCSEAIALCANTPDPADMLFWFYAGPPGVATPSAAQWQRTGQACLRPGEARARQVIPDFTLQDFRRLPLPPGKTHIEPPNLRTLVNVPTNVYVVSRPVTLSTTLVGFPVQVRATPVSYRWSFGDGSTLHTEDPGAPYPDLRTTHTYTKPATASVVLTTAYAGEYSVAGGPWQPVDGVALVDSPAVSLTVVEARGELVGGLPSP